MRSHLLELLDAHLEQMRLDGSYDLSNLEQAWNGFKEKVLRGDFSHHEVDKAIEGIKKASLQRREASSD